MVVFIISNLRWSMAPNNASNERQHLGTIRTAINSHSEDFGEHLHFPTCDNRQWSGKLWTITINSISFCELHLNVYSSFISINRTLKKLYAPLWFFHAYQSGWCYNFEDISNTLYVTTCVSNVYHSQVNEWKLIFFYIVSLMNIRNFIWSYIEYCARSFVQ